MPPKYHIRLNPNSIRHPNAQPWSFNQDFTVEYAANNMDPQ